MAFAEYQNEIYPAGQQGENLRLPTTFADLEADTRAALPRLVRGYVAGGPAVDGCPSRQNPTPEPMRRVG